jgi:hypothetical protein
VTATSEKHAPVGFVGNRGRGWALIASWFAPFVMTCAYIVLALTSETDASGWAWMSIGLAFVLVLWWMFRILTQSAAMARAIAVGDADRVLELAGDRPDRRLYRGVGHELRGEWIDALRAVDGAKLSHPRQKVLAAAVRISALVETGEVAKARTVLDSDLVPQLAKLDARMDGASHIAGTLARGRVLCAERAYDDARPVLQKVIDDIRAGSHDRAVAHHYAARVAAATGEVAAADQHRARVTALAPGSWLAR